MNLAMDMLNSSAH